ILDKIHTANTIGPGNFIEVFQQLNRRNSETIEADRNARFEIEGNFAIAIRTDGRIQRQFIDVGWRRLGGIVGDAAFMSKMPESRVVTIDFSLGCANRYVARFRISNGFPPRLNFPFAPGGNNSNLRREGFIDKFEPNLIVPLWLTSVHQS